MARNPFLDASIEHFPPWSGAVLHDGSAVASDSESDGGDSTASRDSDALNATIDLMVALTRVHIETPAEGDPPSFDASPDEEEHEAERLRRWWEHVAPNTLGSPGQPPPPPPPPPRSCLIGVDSDDADAFGDEEGRLHGDDDWAESTPLSPPRSPMMALTAASPFTGLQPAMGGDASAPHWTLATRGGHGTSAAASDGRLREPRLATPDMLRARELLSTPVQRQSAARHWGRRRDAPAAGAGCSSSLGGGAMVVPPVSAPDMVLAQQTGAVIPSLYLELSAIHTSYDIAPAELGVEASANLETDDDENEGGILSPSSRLEQRLSSVEEVASPISWWGGDGGRDGNASHADGADDEEEVTAGDEAGTATSNCTRKNLSGEMERTVLELTSHGSENGALLLY